MGLLLAGCQKSLDKIVIKCNQNIQAIFHHIKIPCKLELVGGMEKEYSVRNNACIGMCESKCARKSKKGLDLNNKHDLSVIFNQNEEL